MDARERAIGIALGVLLGVAVVAAFVFLGGQDAIDDPALSGGDGGRSAAPAPPPVEEVRIIGGAPPASGPVRLDYDTGERIRLRLVSDQAVEVQVLGYGIRAAVGPGRVEEVGFEAARAGNFPVVVTGSTIAVAEIRVGDAP